MEALAGKALLFRKIDYGEADLILTFFSLNYGKVSVIAKSAKNSRKRFGGVLELFSLLEINTTGSAKKRGLPVLNEAKIVSPFAALRGDFRKTAYAAYWCDLVYHFAEENEPMPEVFRLLCFSLEALCAGAHTPEFLSVVFQSKLAQLLGFEPNLKDCAVCGTDVFVSGHPVVGINIAAGGLICDNCMHEHLRGALKLQAGTLKPMVWVLEKPLDAALRARFSDRAVVEALHFWEAFLPYHFDKKLKSLDFLRQIR